jgi:hypothetical protein
VSTTRLRDDTWVWALAGLAVGLFGLGFVVRWRCTVGTCALAGHEWLFDIDAVGGLPRLFTTSLFVATAVAAAVVARRRTGRARLWWSAVTALGVGLVGAKLVSVHSLAEAADGRGTTLLVGVASTVVGLPVLAAVGRAWRVPRTGAVVLALAAYALAALGLDQVTGVVTALDPAPLPDAAATLVEELGEALAALVLLVVVVRRVPGRRRGRH